MTFFSHQGHAREELKISQKIKVLSDKAFRKTEKNLFEAIGNVVITQAENTIYGEKSSLNLTTGESQVLGNVRYIGSNITIYGTQLDYNFLKDYLRVKNARILTKEYTVTGTQIIKHPSGEIEADEAEYSTCRDCPESWSIYGDKVHITLGQYIRIKHALLKVNGVIVLYIPYIVLPIKKGRETGFLLPKFAVDLQEGVRYQQPFFFVLGDTNDLTMTPSVFGKRGLGGEFQVRQHFKEYNWMEFNSVTVFDRIYEPLKTDVTLSGEKKWRSYGEYEHHFSLGTKLNHHFSMNAVNDLDMIRDFDFFVEKKITGTDHGGESFLEFAFPWLYTSVEAGFKRSLLLENPKGFDHSYVQVLPSFELDILPLEVLNTSILGLQNISLGVNNQFTIFKQNHTDEVTAIRNAHRLDAKPYIDWQLGMFGPVQISTNITYDYQHYRFPYQRQETFTKNALVYETSAKIEFDKIFGLAYTANVPIDENDKKKAQKDAPPNKLLGELPSFRPNIIEGLKKQERRSYRHNQEWKVKHYYISNQSQKGNPVFYEQITRNDRFGIFDEVDTIREREFELNDTPGQITLPKRNSLELQWNNTLIRKAPKNVKPFEDFRSLRDNYEYSQVAYFNVSQGYDLRVESEDVIDSLTRLNIQTGLSVNRFTLSMNEYYFYNIQKHVFTSNIKQEFDQFYIGAEYNFNSLFPDIGKNVLGEAGVKLSDALQFDSRYLYDIEDKETVSARYAFTITPANNCWSLQLGYERNVKRNDISIDFKFNYNGFALNR